MLDIINKERILCRNFYHYDLSGYTINYYAFIKTDKLVQKEKSLTFAAS